MTNFLVDLIETLLLLPIVLIGHILQEPDPLLKRVPIVVQLLIPFLLKLKLIPGLVSLVVLCFQIQKLFWVLIVLLNLDQLVQFHDFSV